MENNQNLALNLIHKQINKSTKIKACIRGSFNFLGKKKRKNIGKTNKRIKFEEK